MNSIEGPTYFIQYKWEEILDCMNSEVWVSCQFRNEDLKQGKIIRKENDKAEQFRFSLSATNDFQVNLLSPRSIVIGLKDLNFTCLFIAPSSTFENLHESRITSIDISSESFCVTVSCEDECKLATWLSIDERKLKTSRYHDGSIYKCRWFPDGRALLSFGKDSHLKIWCSDTCGSPILLKGHTDVVTDVAFVDRGHNIISVSKDGSCKIWNCRNQRCIDNIAELPSRINCCSLCSVPSTFNVPDVNPPKVIDKDEIGTQDKIILIGCEDGTICCIVVRSRIKIFEIEMQSAVNCICSIKETMFAAGFQDGSITVFERLWDNEPVVVSWFETNSPVLCIASFRENGFFVGHQDGSCIYRTIHKVECPARLCLSSPMGFPIVDMCCDAYFVYTGCADAKVRTYCPYSLIEKYFCVYSNDDDVEESD